jgi:hypothetical protein
MSTWLTFAKGARLHPMEANMRTLLSVLAVGLFVLVAAPQNALACHKDTPHGMETSCDGGVDQKIVFITSDTYDGGLNPDPNSCGTGVDGGNCICQYHADQAGLSGVFLAWLADDMGNPFNTWAQSEVPWVRVDGVMVALNWDDLFDGTILAAIEVDEEGNHPGVGSGGVGSSSGERRVAVPPGIDRSRLPADAGPGQSDERCE